MPRKYLSEEKWETQIATSSFSKNKKRSGELDVHLLNLKKETSLNTKITIHFTVTYYPVRDYVILPWQLTSKVAYLTTTATGKTGRIRLIFLLGF